LFNLKDLLVEGRIVIAVIIEIRRRRRLRLFLFIGGSDYQNNGNCDDCKYHENRECRDKELEEALEETTHGLYRAGKGLA